jgi:hypothetical protein
MDTEITQQRAQFQLTGLQPFSDDGKRFGTPGELATTQEQEGFANTSLQQQNQDCVLQQRRRTKLMAVPRRGRKEFYSYRKRTKLRVSGRNERPI